MKKMIMAAAIVLAGVQAHAIGLTQTAIAITVLPTATLSASISGVQKAVLYRDGVDFVLRSEVDPNAAPSLALQQELNEYASKKPTNETALQLTNRLLAAEIANDQAYLASKK